MDAFFATWQDVSPSRNATAKSLRCFDAIKAMGKDCNNDGVKTGD
jgi:hypothetical protein